LKLLDRQFQKEDQEIDLLKQYMSNRDA
jgi:hypothetical protein